MDMNTIKTAVQHRRDTLADALAQVDSILTDCDALAAGDLRPFFSARLAAVDADLAALGARLAHQREVHKVETARIREEARERVETRWQELGARRELSDDQRGAAMERAERAADEWAVSEIEADAARAKGFNDQEARHGRLTAHRAELAAAASSGAVLHGDDATRAAVSHVAGRLVAALGAMDVRPEANYPALASVDGPVQARLTAAATKTA